MKTLYIIIDLASLEAAKMKLKYWTGQFINVNTFAQEISEDNIDTLKMLISKTLKGLSFEFKTF